MNRYSTGLYARNFGEWLAALGLLRVADSMAAGAMLSFSPSGEAILDCLADEKDLLSTIVASANPEAILVNYLVGCEEPDLESIRVGDGFYKRTSHSLGQQDAMRHFTKCDDAKKGCYLSLQKIGGLEISHFLGSALSAEASLESPLVLWAGQVTFQGILKNISEKVAGSHESGSLARAISVSSRETQRFRFDHADEQFQDDGAHDSSAGRECRFVVEWLALIGLSFFPAGLGFESLSPKRRHMVSRTWKNPLTSTSVALALHSARAPVFCTFFSASDGKMKKLRRLSFSLDSTSTTNQP